MLKFTMKRLVYLVLVLVGVSFLVFLLLYMTPGDPVRMMLGESATPEAQAELRLELGLDDPFLVQYGRYIKNIVVHQDLGTSYSTRRPVLDEIMTVFPNTDVYKRQVLSKYSRSMKKLQELLTQKN